MDRHLRSEAIMIEVSSPHIECTRFNLGYSQMSAVAVHHLQRVGSDSNFSRVPGIRPKYKRANNIFPLLIFRLIDLLQGKP